MSGNTVIIDTGDAIYHLARSTGNRTALGLWLTRCLERFSYRVADRVVVRGTFHRHSLSQKGVQAEVIQDGVDTRIFTRLNVDGLRKHYDLENVLTVGLVGSSVWSDKLGMCYGWELVELVNLLKHAPIKGIIIGDGSGIPPLQARCKEYGIKDKVLFLGRIPYEQLPCYLNLIDVCLSTQTNDLVGQVRTTGKLPLYLATGRYILASKVGEAALVLGDEMLVEYEGVNDAQYPQKLAARIKTLLEQPELLEKSLRNISIAKAYFDYSILAARMKSLLDASY